MTILSGIESFASFILNISRDSGGETTNAIWFQALAVLTMFFAVVFMGMEWDLRRNKWPEIEERHMALDLASSIANPKYTPEEYHRLRIESLKKRKKLALSEGNEELANQYQSEIDETRKYIKDAG